MKLSFLMKNMKGATWSDGVQQKFTLKVSLSLSVLVNGFWPLTKRGRPYRRAHSMQLLLAADQDSQSIYEIIK